jgi:hypothetical protein
MNVLSPSLRPAIISAVVALALYSITIPGTYVYDDRYIVQADPRLSDMSRWGEYWTKDYFLGGADNLYRPLVSMSYAIQVKLHGNDEPQAWAFHLVNWLLYAGVCALVAELARRITSSRTIALAAGLVFAVHPIHVEAVANIVGRAELLCGLGMLAALVLFLKPMTTARAIAVWACFVLALLSKEQGMLTPLLLLAAAPMAPRGDDPKRRRDAMAALALAVMLSLAAYVLTREHFVKFWWDRSFLDWSINPIVRSTGVSRWLMPFVLLGHYVALLVAPVKLTFDYGAATIGSVVSRRDPYLWLGIATTVIAAAGLVWAIVRRAWSVALCLLAFGLLFGMVSNLLTLIGTNFAERLMFIPSAFLCILVAIGLARLPRRAMLAVLVVVVMLFATRTVTYAWRWDDRVRLYERAVAEHPENVRLWMILGEELSMRGRHEEALRAMARGREVEPGYYKIWSTSAMAALRAGRLDDVEPLAREAHRLQFTLTTGAILEELAKARAATRPATAPSTAPSQ